MLNKRKTLISETILPKIKNSNNKIHVALLYGGMSTEREVSLMSFEVLRDALLEAGYKVTPVDMGYDFALAIAKIEPDVVYNGLYGTYGEDGCVPGTLNLMGVKYTHSGILASAIGMDKIFSGDIFMAHGIKCPERKIIHRNDKLTHDPFPRPYVIKPPCEGSSIGVELIFKEDFFDFAKYSWPYGDKIIAERYIPGKEIAVGVLGGKAVGAIEVRPINRRFHDYTSKYVPNMSEHIMPANISKTAYEKCLKIAEKVHHTLGCKSLSRIDFRYDPDEGKDGEFYLLEINTHPGMTKLSMVPDICKYVGIPNSKVVDIIIKDCI